MKDILNLNESEKNRIRKLHLAESKNFKLTSVLNEQSESPGFKVGDPNCINFVFKRGEIEVIEDLPRMFPTIVKLIDKGMRGDRPFIKIEAGTSGTGSDEENRKVMEGRIDRALKMVIRGAFDLVGESNLPYSESAIMNRVEIDRNYNTIEPGSILPSGEQVPTDEDDPYFNQFQYIKVCFNPIVETPNYGKLADQFVKATIEKTGLNPTDDDTVYFILDTLRDSGDFMEFNKELKNDYGMDFYEIACDRTAIDLNPWMDGETKIGPPELGGSDTTINAQLRRLGVAPIKC